MKILASSASWVVRLDRGDRLSEAMNTFFAESGVTSASVVGIGGASDIVLGFYRVNTHQYLWNTFNDLHEIAALSGSIALDEGGEPVYHLHGSFSSLEFAVIGGHVKDFVAGATVELIVRPLDVQLRRVMDETVGLAVLEAA